MLKDTTNKIPYICRPQTYSSHMTHAANQAVLTKLLPELIQIEGGTFQMGSNESDRERPIHTVKVADFHLGKFPVTNAQYATFLNQYQSSKVKTGPFQGEEMIYTHHWGLQEKGDQWQASIGFEDYPVIRVTWYGATEFCHWLSQQTKQAYRLPSEAEWEYAARGGKYKGTFTYAGSNHLDEVAWYKANSHSQTKPVGLKYPNQLGLYDMSGNVWEWCADHWHKDYKGARQDGAAWIQGDDKSPRVVRGGSWDNLVNSCRVSDRLRFDADVWFNFIGFRVARY